MIFARFWIFHYMGGKLKCFSAVWWNAVTRNILTIDCIQMTTTQTSTNLSISSTAATVDTTKTLASSTAESKKKPTWKWSGEDTPFEHRRWDDDEDNEDNEDDSDKHKFGLCCTCKKGLDDRADFVCNNTQQPGGGFYMLCMQCYEDYSKPWYLAEETHGA